MHSNHDDVIMTSFNRTSPIMFQQLQVLWRPIQKHSLHDMVNEEKCYFRHRNHWCVATMFTSSINHSIGHIRSPTTFYRSWQVFGPNPSRNTACMTCQMKKSAILHRNQWCVATMMTSSWRHSIGHITTYVSSLMASLVKIHPETQPVWRAKQRKVLFYIEVRDA